MSVETVLSYLDVQYVVDILREMSRETNDGAVTSNEMAVRIQDDDGNMANFDTETIRQAVVEVRIH